MSLSYELERPYGLLRVLGGYLLALIGLTAIATLVFWITGGPRESICMDADPITGRPIGCEAVPPE
jgi:hypothetical protein